MTPFSYPYETPKNSLDAALSYQSPKAGVKRASTACQSCKRIKRKVSKFGENNAAR